MAIKKNVLYIQNIANFKNDDSYNNMRHETPIEVISCHTCMSHVFYTCDASGWPHLFLRRAIVCYIEKIFCGGMNEIHLA